MVGLWEVMPTCRPSAIRDLSSLQRLSSRNNKIKNVQHEKIISVQRKKLRERRGHAVRKTRAISGATFATTIAIVRFNTHLTA